MAETSTKARDDRGAHRRLLTTVGLVAAYVSNNSIRAADIPGLIETVYGSLGHLGAPPRPPREVVPPVPAVPVKKSIMPDHLVCLEDGKKFRSLKRHLGTVYGMTPEQYREKWGLSRDYPMVAPEYSAVRSRLAKDIGLGRPGGPVPPAPDEPATTVKTARNRKSRT